jgi:DNA-binding transcriptional MerR regulator
MDQLRYNIVLRHSERALLSLDALAQRTGVHPTLIASFVELQLIEPVRREGSSLQFDSAALLRVRTICRLRKTLGVNYAGTAVILDLLDKLAALRQENRRLRITPA